MHLGDIARGESRRGEVGGRRVDLDATPAEGSYDREKASCIVPKHERPAAGSQRTRTLTAGGRVCAAPGGEPREASASTTQRLPSFPCSRCSSGMMLACPLPSLRPHYRNHKLPQTSVMYS